MGRRRNLVIIAHVNHGKSTLADRLLELTGVIAPGGSRAQVLDSLELERERGMTIKMQPVNLTDQAGHPRKRGDEAYEINLIDTPGHVDFAYEVSRALAAVEGAILLVDATQGIQAQTLANLELARDHNLVIVPVVNKIDLPSANPDRTGEELAHLLDCPLETVIAISAKTGENVPTVLEAVINHLPPPAGDPTAPLQALIFDAQYDRYRGVIIHIRLFAGQVCPGDRLTLVATGQTFVAEEVGQFILTPQAKKELIAGDIGYIVTGLKTVAQSRVGDTVTAAARPSPRPLPGFAIPQPMVYAALYPVSGEVATLRTALEKLAVSDAALQFTPHVSEAFGPGFRGGFLGLLHLEIVKERLAREFACEPVVATPTVAIEGTEGEGLAEPWIEAKIITPPSYLGPILESLEARRGVYQSLEYLGVSETTQRAILTYQIPLAEIIFDFHDQLKSLTAGYASFSYRLLGYRPARLVALDILVRGEVVSPLRQLIPEAQADRRARSLVDRLKELIPRQQFAVVIQAAVGGKIIARATISPYRKDVTAALYGGDITRKRKLLTKQKRGKRRLEQWGKVVIPSTVFLSVFKPPQP